MENGEERGGGEGNKGGGERKRVEVKRGKRGEVESGSGKGKTGEVERGGGEGKRGKETGGDGRWRGEENGIEVKKGVKRGEVERGRRGEVEKDGEKRERVEGEK